MRKDTDVSRGDDHGERAVGLDVLTTEVGRVERQQAADDVDVTLNSGTARIILTYDLWGDSDE